MKTVRQSGLDDNCIRPEWDRGELPPLIFIIGLHRSGTTFLYESLCKVLRLTKLTVQHVACFPHLIHSHKADAGRADASELSEYFRAHSSSTRGNDSLSLTPETAEEYGWILKKYGGSFRLRSENAGIFHDLLRKLAYMHPDGSPILLKNPWDTALAPDLAARYPQAKFLFIRRDPIEILNSELGNALYFSSRKDPLLSLLSDGLPGTRALLAVSRLLRRLAGEKFFSRVMLRLLFADVVNNVRAYNVALAATDAARATEVNYAGLVDEPGATLRQVAEFLGQPLQNPLECIAARRRSGGLHPLLGEREAELRSRLHDAGLQGAQGNS